MQLLNHPSLSYQYYRYCWHLYTDHWTLITESLCHYTQINHWMEESSNGFDFLMLDILWYMTDSECPMHFVWCKDDNVIMKLYLMFIHVILHHAARFTLHIIQHWFSIKNLHDTSTLYIVYSFYIDLICLNIWRFSWISIYNRYTSLFYGRKYCLIYSFFFYLGSHRRYYIIDCIIFIYLLKLYSEKHLLIPQRISLYLTIGLLL